MRQEAARARSAEEEMPCSCEGQERLPVLVRRREETAVLPRQAVQGPGPYIDKEAKQARRLQKLLEGDEDEDEGEDSGEQ
jgi:hypothetical protein